MLSFFNFRNSIGTLLFKKIFLGYIILVLSIGFYQVFTQYNFAKKLIEKDFMTFEKSFSSILSNSLWNFDEETLNNEANAMLSFPGIDGLSIISPNKEILIYRGIVSSSLESYSIAKSQKIIKIAYLDNLIEYKFPLIHTENNNEEVLGEVSLFLKESKIYEMLLEGVSLIFINIIASAFILWILFMFYANKFLTIPLERLINATKELGTTHHNEIEISFNTSRKHELNKLNINFNKMSKKINESINDLIQQKRALKEANKSKDDFLANMSHELKTPLNAINVISSTMMKNKKNLLDESHVKNLQIINSCGNDLLFLINDVLDISKLEAGEITLDMREIDFKKLIYSVKDMIEPQAKQKEINFIFEYDKEIENIYSDENRIKQVLKNLLSNALKFVQKGTIEFIIKDDNDFVRVAVKDDGIGIAEDKLEHIFDRFKQADGSTTRKFGGTGLGLAICKELLVLLEGEIIVESKVNVGTTFHVQIPKNKDKITPSLNSTILNEDKNSEKENILILNNDHISFLSVVINLKKEYFVDNVSLESEFLKLEKEKKYKFLIIDISNLDVNNLDALLSKLSNKVIIVYKDEDITPLNKFTDKFIKKPINFEELLSMLN